MQRVDDVLKKVRLATSSDTPLHEDVAYHLDNLASPNKQTHDSCRPTARLDQLVVAFQPIRHIKTRSSQSCFIIAGPYETDKSRPFFDARGLAFPVALGDV